MPESLFNKDDGLKPASLLKKKLWHRCFLVNFAKFSRTSLLQNTSGRLLLFCLNADLDICSFLFEPVTVG